MLTESKCVRCEQHCFPNIQRSQLKRESHGIVGRTLICSLRCHNKFLLVLEVVLQFSVSVSRTEPMLEEVSLLRGSSLNVRPAQLRNPTLFLRKALCGHVLLALQIHAPGSDRMASSSCGAPCILFTAFQRLALSFRATARWSWDFFRISVLEKPDVQPPSRRVRSGMRVLRKPLCHA